MKFKIFLLLIVYLINLFGFLGAQTCPGSWAVGAPLNYSCIIGVSINQSNIQEPLGCPINPGYISEETNTFYFAQPVTEFKIDFRGFSSQSGCARMEIKINDIFYPLSLSQISDIPISQSCTGSIEFITVSQEGYITSTTASQSFSNGRGRINFQNLNASSITISTNDPAGIVVSTPFDCIGIVPLILQNFSGLSLNCGIYLNWKTGTEENVQSIIIEQGNEPSQLTEIGSVIPKGSNSIYQYRNQSIGGGYLRLKIIDLDGAVTFSNIIYVRPECMPYEYSVYPNPTSGTIIVNGLKPSDRIKVFDLPGRKLRSFDVGVDLIDISDLVPGVYFLTVMKENKSIKSIKVVKK